MERQQKLLDKMGRARRQDQEQLNKISQKARGHNANVDDTNAKDQQAAADDMLKASQQRQEDAKKARAERREATRAKLLQAADKIARASARRKEKEAEEANKLMEKEAREKKAEKIRERRLENIRLKAQDETSKCTEVWQRKQELLEEQESQRREFLDMRSKIAPRLGVQSPVHGARRRLDSPSHASPPRHKQQTPRTTPKANTGFMGVRWADIPFEDTDEEPDIEFALPAKMLSARNSVTSPTPATKSTPPVSIPAKNAADAEAKAKEAATESSTLDQDTS